MQVDLRTKCRAIYPLLAFVLGRFPGFKAMSLGFVFRCLGFNSATQ